MMVLTIAWQEFRRLFLSPLAWACLAVVQFLVAYNFFDYLEKFTQVQGHLAGLDESYGLTDFVAVPVFGYAGIVILFVVPLLAMRQFAEERRSGALVLLLAAPVSVSEIVFGKFLGLFFFLLMMVVIVALMPLCLLFGGTLDLGQLAGGMLGLVLTVAVFAAIGLFASVLTGHPAVAALGSFGVLMLLLFIDNTESTEGLLGYLSLSNHFDSLTMGLFNSTDVLYYVLLAGLFLGLTIARLDAERL